MSLGFSSPTCSFRVLEFVPGNNLKTVWNCKRQRRFEKDSDELVTSSPSPDLRRRNVDKDTSSSIDLLPVELIEVMLSKCPAKSVVRFKSVCKQWHAIISDPRFSRIHRIQRGSKPSETQNMHVMWENVHWLKEPSRIYLIRLEDGKSRVESLFEYPAESFSIPRCGSCDGIFLLYAYYDNGNPRDYMLWNPSIQKGSLIRRHDDSPPPRAYHFYHDATSDDYKIVLVWDKCYSVYSCKSGSWGEMKDLARDLVETLAVSMNGCFYRLRRGSGEVVCFDARDGKVDKFRQPKDIDQNQSKVVVRLAQVSGRLCLYSLTQDGTRIQVWVMEKRGRSFENVCWRRLMSMEKGEGDLRFNRPVCLIDEDKVVLELQLAVWKRKLMEVDEHVIYNTRQKSFQKIELNCVCATQLFQFHENLYLPSSNILV